MAESLNVGGRRIEGIAVSAVSSHGDHAIRARDGHTHIRRHSVDGKHRKSFTVGVGIVRENVTGDWPGRVFEEAKSVCSGGGTGVPLHRAVQIQRGDLGRRRLAREDNGFIDAALEEIGGASQRIICCVRGAGAKDERIVGADEPAGVCIAADQRTVEPHLHTAGAPADHEIIPGAGRRGCGGRDRKGRRGAFQGEKN